jgi:DNA mismatch repair ATPase MutS|tara:strand:- start:497 stop:724 length:228 start_codon:yes stop_codon:yes gene_type:complete
MVKKKITKFIQSSATNRDISSKLDELKLLVIKNSTDIEELKAQVNMGKGGIRAIFAIASMLAIILGLFKFFKLDI